MNPKSFKMMKFYPTGYNTTVGVEGFCVQHTQISKVEGVMLLQTMILIFSCY